MSPYKKRKLRGFCFSVIATFIGWYILEYTTVPSLGVPFLMLGSFAAVYFIAYYFFEYEEDDAGSAGIFNFNAGKIDSDRHNR